MNQKVDQFPQAGSMIFTSPAHFYFPSTPHSPPPKKKNPWRFCLQGFIREWELATLSFPVTGYLAPGPISRFILLFPSAASSPTLFTAHASRRRRSLRPHSRAAATIPDRDLLSEASLPGSVRTCRYGRATHGVDPPTRITL